MGKLNTTVFAIILLVIIGLTAHYPSFNLSLYGDDWIDIFQFFTRFDPGQFSPLPGFLAYFNPYGFAIFLIGNLFKIFSTYYRPYFIISFVFRFAASIGLYLVCLELGRLVSIKQTRAIALLSLLSAVLFLVGYTGIQTTDWAHYMNIYLATALFLFSLVFQLRFYQNFSLKQMYLSLIFIVSSLVVGSLRLYPILVLMPLTDLSLYLLKKKLRNSFRIIYKLVIFLVSAIIFWGIGLFGSPFSFYSYGGWTAFKFLDAVATNLILALKSLLYLIGTLLIPNRLNIKPEINLLIGVMFILVFIITLIKSFKSIKDNIWSMIFGTWFFTFLFTIWYFGPTSLMSSEHRYLLVIFTFFVLWLYILALSFLESFKSSKSIMLAVACLLIIVHAVSSRQFYIHQLDKGRDFKFAKKIEETIIFDLPVKPTSAPFVYFDIDDGEVKQSLLFGLAIKTSSLKQLWDTKYFFNQYDDLEVLKKDLQKRIGKGASKESVFDLIYAFQVRNKQIKNTTDDVKKMLLRSFPDSS